MGEQETLFTTTELAEKSGLGQDYIRQLCAVGKIKAFKRGRDWFISADEVERFLSTRKQ